jgi:hypothetical protein
MDSALPSKKTAAITSYDLLKSLAVITMIVDHVGYYFFPDQLMFRAVGRVSFPIWFFLVGYAKNREITPLLIAGAVVLALADGMIGIGVVPFNVLVTIMLIRLVRERVAAVAFRSEFNFFIVPMLLMALALPSYMITEYGTHGLLLALFGWMIRNRPDVPGLGGRQAIFLYMALILASYGAQQAVFNFGYAEEAVLAMCLVAVMGLLYKFKPVIFPRLTERCPMLIRGIIQFMGRHTLAIYVGHLLLFKLLGVIYEPERFPLFAWKWAQFSI